MVEKLSIDMEENSPKKEKKALKRKKKSKSPVEAKVAKVDKDEKTVNNAAEQKPQVSFEAPTMDEMGERYPVLKDEDLVKKFLGVTMTNNQKGRIRQVLRDNLKGTADTLLPDVIHNRIQAVLQSAGDLTDTDLRKIRILYNMLKTAVQAEKSPQKKSEKKKKKKKNGENKKSPTSDSIDEAKKKKKEESEEKKKQDVSEDKKKEQPVQKVKGKKRYVVFIGNLPLDIDKEKILEHFSSLKDQVVDVRVPPRKPARASAIAYLELKDEPSYELALSKHHSMLGNKRINVLYTTQKKSKVSKAEAKSKSAKLQALQRSGKLLGSAPLARRRSQRRNKMKKARAQAEAS